MLRNASSTSGYKQACLAIKRCLQVNIHVTLADESHRIHPGNEKGQIVENWRERVTRQNLSVLLQGKSSVLPGGISPQLSANNKLHLNIYYCKDLICISETKLLLCASSSLVIVSPSLYTVI